VDKKPQVHWLGGDTRSLASSRLSVTGRTENSVTGRNNQTSLKTKPLLRLVSENPSYISSFEIRYLKHHARYTDEEWGGDYDYMLDDQTTRVRRVHIKSAGEITSAIAPLAGRLIAIAGAGEI